MIVNFFHDLIMNVFPVGTSHYVMHFITMMFIALILYSILESNEKVILAVSALCIFIEFDQLVFNTGVCDILDVVAGVCGCYTTLYLNEFISYLVSRYNKK